jgi:hypothetical protein
LSRKKQPHIDATAYWRMVDFLNGNGPPPDYADSVAWLHQLRESLPPEITGLDGKESKTHNAVLLMAMFCALDYTQAAAARYVEALPGLVDGMSAKSIRRAATETHRADFERETQRHRHDLAKNSEAVQKAQAFFDGLPDVIGKNNRNCASCGDRFTSASVQQTRCGFCMDKTLATITR